MPGTNTLAYLALLSATKKKSFITFTPDCDAIVAGDTPIWELNELVEGRNQKILDFLAKFDVNLLRQPATNFVQSGPVQSGKSRNL